ncbi:MAG: hypothetical protein IPK33_17610 [Gemmatimonadetes bacterium]|nr:hypothetical protein [Gemmatimonadota bacterium]
MRSHVTSFCVCSIETAPSFPSLRRATIAISLSAVARYPANVGGTRRLMREASSTSARTAGDG